MHTDTFRVAIRRVRPGALRDIQRDWESWNLGEKIAIAALAFSLSMFPLGHWFGLF
jgi:hypothetical protein